MPRNDLSQDKLWEPIYRGGMPAASAQLKVLGDFFRARRAEANPASLPAGSITGTTRRRVKGLRREEVAHAVGISSDYYTRVEQGRLAPSPQVLDGLCRLMRLTPEQTAYAEDLLNHARGIDVTASGHGAADDRLQLLLDQLNELPAMVLGPRMSILAWNPLAAALLADFTKLPAAQRNYIVMTFTLPAMRELYDDWDDVARTCVGVLRREAAHNPDDPELAALVGRLSIADADFRRWWAEHRIDEQDFGAKIFNHPTAGRMRLNWDSFTYAGATSQQLILWSATPNTPDADALRRLIEA